MKTVRFGTSDVVYPVACACCLAPPQGRLKIEKEDMKSLAAAIAVKAAGGSTLLMNSLRNTTATSVPYCRECMNHVGWTRMGGWLGVALSLVLNAFLGVLAGGLVLGFASVLEPERLKALGEWGEYGVVGTTVLIGVALTGFKVRLRPKGPLDRRHAKDGHSIEIGAVSADQLELICHNPRFAEQLVAANPGAALALPVRLPTQRGPAR